MAINASSLPASLAAAVANSLPHQLHTAVNNHNGASSSSSTHVPLPPSGSLHHGIHGGLHLPGGATLSAAPMPMSSRGGCSCCALSFSHVPAAGSRELSSFASAVSRKSFSQLLHHEANNLRLLAEMASRKLTRSFALPVRQTAMYHYTADAKRAAAAAAAAASSNKKDSKDTTTATTTGPIETGWAKPMPGTANHHGTLSFSLVIRRLQHGIQCQRRARANNALAAIHAATTKSTKKSKKKESRNEAKRETAATNKDKENNDTNAGDEPAETDGSSEGTKTTTISISTATVSAMGPSDLSAEERRTVALVRRRFRDAALRTSSLGDTEAAEDYAMTRDWPARGALVIEISVTEAAAPVPNYDTSRYPIWMPLAELLRFVNAKDPALFLSVLIATSDPSTLPLLTVVRFGRGPSQCVPFLSVLPLRSAHILSCRSNEYASLVERGPLLSLMEAKVEPMEALLFRRVMLQAADNYGNGGAIASNLAHLTSTSAAAAAAAAAVANSSNDRDRHGHHGHHLSSSDPLGSSFVTHSLLWLLDAFVPAALGRALPADQQEQLRTIRNTHCSAELVVAINDFVVGSDSQLIRVLPLLQSLRTAVANTFMSQRLHLDLWCTHGEEWRVAETHQLARWLATRHQRIRNKMAALRQLHAATTNNSSCASSLPVATTAMGTAPPSSTSTSLRRDLNETTCVLCGSLAIYRCDSCNTACYCSRRHAQRHWYTGHRNECATLTTAAATASAAAAAAATGMPTPKQSVIATPAAAVVASSSSTSSSSSSASKSSSSNATSATSAVKNGQQQKGAANSNSTSSKNRSHAAATVDRPNAINEP